MWANPLVCTSTCNIILDMIIMDVPLKMANVMRMVNSPLVCTSTCNTGPVSLTIIISLYVIVSLNIVVSL